MSLTSLPSSRRLARLARPVRFRRNYHSKSSTSAQAIYFLLVFLLFFTVMLIAEFAVYSSPRNSFEQSGIFDRWFMDFKIQQEMGNMLTNSQQLAAILNEQPDSENNGTIVDDPRMEQLFERAETEGDRWQSVANTSDRFYVYSAWIDETKQQIRIIAAARTRTGDRVMCRMWHERRRLATVLASSRLIRENWNMRYSAYFFLCPVPRFLEQSVPDAVSIMRVMTHSVPNNVLRVHRLERPLYTENHTTATLIDRGRSSQLAPAELAVCVKPMHYSYDNLTRFQEFIYFNRILGVGHFYFYNHSIGSNVECWLNEYIRRKWATVLSWQLPLRSQKEIRTEGQFCALNDCLYRTRAMGHRWVAMIDFDEFIVPHDNHTTLLSLLHSLDKPNDGIGAFSFQNAFFYLSWPDDQKWPPPELAAMNASDSVDALTLRKTRRKLAFHPHRQRSKVVVKPVHVVEIGNHFVWEFRHGFKMFNVPPKIAFLRHYRICEFGGISCLNTSFVIDRKIWSWKKPLLKSLISSAASHNKICHPSSTSSKIVR